MGSPGRPAAPPTFTKSCACFKAASAATSGSSATVNEKQAAKVQAGTQAYFAYYNPNDWTGSLTANNLIDTAGVVSVSTTANWDAQCVLIAASPPAPYRPVEDAPVPVSRVLLTPRRRRPSRVILTFDGSKGVPFEWSSLSANQQAVLDDENNTADSSATSQYRLNYLRGDRSNEITTTGSGLYRARDGVLGDIVDSSPTWVGPPSLPYTATWSDHLQSTATMPENTGTQTYVQYVGAQQTRLNVVYTGANDGLLHGFRAGSFDSGGNFCGTPAASISCSSTPNDGQEVLAYMPGSVLYSPALSTSVGGCAGTNTTTGTVVQNIHGWTPSITSGSPAVTSNQCETPELDYSATPYGHNFFVDATPGTGDLFYSGTWHTWLVGGLGAGGKAIYALDVTNPGSFSESSATAQAIVQGEWNAATLTTCVNVATGCGTNLGNTFGTPQIRRLHNGSWAAIFGNGFGSVTGDAGIYVMSVSTSGAITFYYLSTGTGTGTTTSPCTSGCNGIAYTTPADLDGDHITDYVYAGDLQGNVWRFDLTSATPSLWGVTNAGGASINKPSGTGPGQGGGGTAAPLFTTRTGQPITTQLLVVSNIVPGIGTMLQIEFGTGQRTQITNAGPEVFVGGTQSLYGVLGLEFVYLERHGAGQSVRDRRCLCDRHCLAVHAVVQQFDCSIAHRRLIRHGQRYQRHGLLAGEHVMQRNAEPIVRLVRQPAGRLGADHLQSGVLPGRDSREFHDPRSQLRDVLHHRHGYRLYLRAFDCQRRRVHECLPDLYVHEPGHRHQHRGIGRHSGRRSDQCHRQRLRRQYCRE